MKQFLQTLNSMSTTFKCRMTEEQKAMYKILKADGLATEKNMADKKGAWLVIVLTDKGRMIADLENTF